MVGHISIGSKVGVRGHAKLCRVNTANKFLGGKLSLLTKHLNQANKFSQTYSRGLGSRLAITRNETMGLYLEPPVL